MSFVEARDLATKSDKWLVVDFTAQWCPPCKNMERTTWCDPAVVEWLDANAICIQVDGDAEPALTAQYEIRAYPSILCFDSEHEFDRLIGARSAADFLKWLEGLERGTTELDGLLKVDPEDLDGRATLATKLLDLGRDEEALEGFAWLWEHALGVSEAWVGVRSTFLLQAARPLLERLPSARARFSAFRDEAATRATPRDWGDFVVLNEFLGDDARTLEWLRVTTPEIALAADVFSPGSRLLKLIERHDDWVVVGHLLLDPSELLGRWLVKARRIIEREAELPAELRDSVARQFVSMNQEFAEFLLGALCAADRLEEADAVEQLARQHDPSTDMQAAIARARSP
jgi:hypothetical protein